MSHTGTPGMHDCRTKYGCGACRFFDCGFYCKCDCHSHPQVRKPIYTGPGSAIGPLKKGACRV